jgi:hypothetical protein
MQLHISFSGAISIGDHAAGSIRFDKGSSVVRCDVDGRRIDARLFGPFGQGYNFSMMEIDVELLRLEYDWRNGASIYRPRHTGSSTRTGPLLYYGNRRLIAPKGIEAGHVTIAGDGLDIGLVDLSLPFDITALALLIAIDTMYYEGIALFGHT